MDNRLKSLISTDEKSNWLEDAKRRKRWRWLTNLTLRPRIKLLRLKRRLKDTKRRH